MLKSELQGLGIVEVVHVEPVYGFDVLRHGIGRVEQHSVENVPAARDLQLQVTSTDDALRLHFERIVKTRFRKSLAPHGL